MKYVFVSLFLLSTVFSTAQKIDKREIKSFDKIEVTGNISVEMIQGDVGTLQIKTKNVDASEVITEVDDKLLKIKMRSNLFDDKAEVKIKVYYDVIREITSNASAEIKFMEKVTGDKIFIEATSGGRVLLSADLNAVELKSYQGAHIDITGTCKIQESYINTGGVLAAGKFQCDEVFIRMNTGGNAEVVANKKIEANVNTGAKLSFFGKPKDEKLKTTLGGNITKWDE